MLQQLTLILDGFGLCVFAVTGALVASRMEMDIVGFALLDSVTGIGGGTIRDVQLGVEPVFWVRQPVYLVTCVAVSSVMFFLAHIPQSRERVLQWFDAVGLSLFPVTGTVAALAAGAGPVIAIAMRAATATFGGIIRDILGEESAIILKQEVYITAALLGATVFVFFGWLGAAPDPSAGLAFLAAFS